MENYDAHVIVKNIAVAGSVMSTASFGSAVNGSNVTGGVNGNTY
jgi:hypothetical protein